MGDQERGHDPAIVGIGDGSTERSSFGSRADNGLVFPRPDADARRRRRLVGHEEGRRERLARIHPVRSKSVTPSAARNVSSIRKLPVKLFAGFWKMR